MAPAIATPERHQPLPPVPGPRLAPFTETAHVDIEFIEQLGNPFTNLDGHIWKVRLNGHARLYALKLFHFISSEHLKYTTGSTLMRPLASSQLYIDYLDPFNCECRVYGRLKDEGREDLAIRAHGYLLLTPEQEAEVSNRSHGFIDPPVDRHALILDRSNAWGRWEEHRGLPLRAIVKDFVEDHVPPFTPTQLPNLWRDMEDLHKLGILVRDVSVGNYLDGKLVDFGHAWTVPHPCLEYISQYWLEKFRRSDPLDLQAAIIDYAMGTNSEEWRGWQAPEDLWKCASGRGPDEGNDRYGTDPREYDWLKWEEDFEAVRVFYEQELYAEDESDGEDGEE